ncbi:MAG: glycoside hydrolase/phage tail family protein [Methylobacterium mesophilicum]|nr:glycoside hydrolase/phage tail family protein [Methylobacterium mesophilicum]
MATIILQAAGAYLGGALGATGAALGTAAGALAGYAVDRALLSGTKRIEGPRLTAQKPFTAEEGAALPRVYGSVRLSGTLIWATRFEEKRETRRQGGKGGGAKVSEYSYFGNAAFALCEGPIAGVRRIWADGKEIDRESVELRVHVGSETQAPDPLIAVKQGENNAPAYRGTAVVVIERMALGPFGNRLPQMQFEVLKPVGLLHERLRAVALIPGSTEYGLSPKLVTQTFRPGESEAVNRHVLHADTDIAASLDELQMLCPNLEHVALVVSWFGDDLRADRCRIRPSVTDRGARWFSESWSASGVARGAAREVSRHRGQAAYGGTPSDESVIGAVREIRSRGLKATLYPFVMMDVPEGNALPDPYGGAEQASYPWRGRITVDPAPGHVGSPDRTEGVQGAVATFCGEAGVDDFAVQDGAVRFRGAQGDWGYRRLILHYAHLAQAAGGVDAFLIGSELRGLSTLRSGARDFPFVDQLCRLAAECRAILGSGTAITYGADWSEYFGHQPADGSGDALFHLDPLWAHPAISAVGIDNYMPLSDWRDADHAGGNPDGALGPSDDAALRRAIAGGEGFSWFYASAAHRGARLRTPITDGAYDKPWVFRPKDLAGWWSNPHHDRIGGVEEAEPTTWRPCSKPIWLTELGCPAADKGANQPNVFPDPKSAESARPYFSNGGRSDLVQRRFLEAHLRWWDPSDGGFGDDANPVSPVYGGRMLDPARIYAWAWDARPFPAFPLNGAVWGDSANWQAGHWLNGRLEAPALADLFEAVLRDHGLPAPRCEAVEGSVQGYLVEPGSARDALEPLVELFDLSVSESADEIDVRGKASSQRRTVDAGEIVVENDGAALVTTREGDLDLPAEMLLNFQNPLKDYQGSTARVSRLSAASRRQQSLSLPVVLDPGAAEAIADDWLRGQWRKRDELRLSLAPRVPVEPGTVLDGLGDPLLVTDVESGLVQRVTARRLGTAIPAPWRAAEGGGGGAATAMPSVGKPHLLLLDLPSLNDGQPPENCLRVAAYQKPWRSQSLSASPGESGFEFRAQIARQANVGRLVSGLGPGVPGRFWHGAPLDVELYAGEAASVARANLLNGANVLAVRSRSGAWEIMQFASASEIAPGIFRLTSLLRGQLGTEDAMMAGSAEGADAVILDDAVLPAGLRPAELGLELNWRATPSGADLSEQFSASVTALGGVRARMPLAPVHLRVEARGASGVRFSWVRRGRVDADSWEGPDIPLGEEREVYQVALATPSRTVASVEVGESTWLCPADLIETTAGEGRAEALTLSVRQGGGRAGWGFPASRVFAVQDFII